MQNSEKNSITDMMNGKKIPRALSPCLKAECEGWRDEEFIQIRNAGKPERLQVFSRMAGASISVMQGTQSSTSL